MYNRLGVQIFNYCCIQKSYECALNQIKFLVVGFFFCKNPAPSTQHPHSMLVYRYNWGASSFAAISSNKFVDFYTPFFRSVLHFFLLNLQISRMVIIWNFMSFIPHWFGLVWERNNVSLIRVLDTPSPWVRV